MSNQETKAPVTKFHFKEIKKDGVTIEPKRASFETTIVPEVGAQNIVDIIFSDTESDERKEKLLNYLARLHNDQVYKAAQLQIGAKLASFGDNLEAKIAYVLTDADLDTSKLDLWTLAYTEPAQRGGGKQFSDELVADTIKSFVDFGVANFKKADGTPVSREGLVKSADEIFKNRFKNTKSDKRTIQLFKDRITLWFAGINPELQTAYAAFAENLIGKADNYLNPSNESVIGKFE
jgi:hypothetical protein